MDLFINDSVYCNLLDINGLANAFNNVSNSYKYYWFDAILELIKLNHHKNTFTFEEIANQMIVDAWYSVVQFHLSISINSDALENAVNRLHEIDPFLTGTSNREDIITSIKIHETKDTEFRKARSTMLQMVPMRFLSEFLSKNDEGKLHISNFARFAKYVNESDIIFPYSFEKGTPITKRKIVLNVIWKQMFIDYYPILKNWVQYEKVEYLQSRNPTVPGMIYKLVPDNGTRKLTKARKLWSSAMKVEEFNDIYTHEPLNDTKYDLDHFIPWSYIAHDELWNLIPADKSMNCSKNNLLPQWDVYFELFAHEQYKLYQVIQEYSQIKYQFDACRADNLNSIWGQKELYRFGNDEVEFTNILEKNMKPIFDAAKIQGYAEDIFTNLL